MERDVLLGNEELDKELFQARVGVPINLPEIVTAAIGAEVGKLHATAPIGAATLPLDLTAPQASADHREAVKLR
jgi:hypothetical protein